MYFLWTIPVSVIVIAHSTDSHSVTRKLVVLVAYSRSIPGLKLLRRFKLILGAAVLGSSVNSHHRFVWFRQYASPPISQCSEFAGRTWIAAGLFVDMVSSWSVWRWWRGWQVVLNFFVLFWLNASAMVAGMTWVELPASSVSNGPLSEARCLCNVNSEIRTRKHDTLSLNHQFIMLRMIIGNNNDWSWMCDIDRPANFTFTWKTPRPAPASSPARKFVSIHKQSELPISQSKGLGLSIDPCKIHHWWDVRISGGTSMVYSRVALEIVRILYGNYNDRLALVSRK